MDMDLASPLPVNAIVHPNVSLARAGSARILPFYVSLNFAGEIPPHLANQDIPISISVSVAPELEPYTTLSLRAHTKDETEENPDSDWSSDSESIHGDTSSYDDIPFLPLPSTFDRKTPSCWAHLSDNIRNWLLTVRPDSGIRAWGTELFWISWIGAHLHFPYGHWPKWDNAIPLEGSFIESWLTDAYARGPHSTFPTSDAAANFVWSEFLRHASPFCTDLVHSS
ncbi:hypothetical protein CONPUDRAFT_166038 [Coniophora puteana RWD-64-598 SS2]|uniref:Uncharacterized protein n=1 Tax=Coniophora puteana (strain RWD-64-598) TaxID=741705 RepID=A0A5M3MNC1_CONPW|nr:uncharacterized protein CONPUDRAFT_166038 [Coniophora puteana RWD-64-598 SS2]EIW80536.1 hypothetical protein CONPUDRAFT_166038 [Coniophora puteana RWD-64-598 SS2]